MTRGERPALRYDPDIARFLEDIHGACGGRLRRELRADERYRRLPIIAFTANALPAEQDHCREAGMDGYVTKPIKSAIRSTDR